MAGRTGSQQPPDKLGHLSPRIRRHIRALDFGSEKDYLNWCRASGFTARINKNSGQMKTELGHRQTERTDDERQKSLLDHLRQLGLDSIQTYRVWCRKNGFGVGLHKTAAQRAREVVAGKAGRQDRSSDRGRSMDRRRELRRNLAATVDQMIRGDLRKRSLTDPVLIRLHALVDQNRDPGHRKAAVELLEHVDQNGLPVDIAPAIGHLGNVPGNTILDALFALARHHDSWIRSVGAWRPSAKSRQHRFGELARHLLANYFVPEFLDAAWFAGTDESAIRQQSWFVHIGQGGNIRTADTPLKLTKRMAHLFLQAPGWYSVSQTMRWAQVLGFGGDQETAEHIIATRMGEHLENDEFWVEVVHFFLNNPMLDYDEFGPIVDFVHNEREVPVEIRLPDGSTVTQPRQPDFSMKGRTAERLLDAVHGWHKELSQIRKVAAGTWETSGIRPFRKTVDRDGKTTIWSTKEILSQRDLVDEGRAMHHCVASYAPYCVRGQKSVWSLTVEEPETGYSDRVLTIAINNSARRVVQARGRCNALPGVRGHDNAANRVLRNEGDRLKQGRDMMRQWGEKESLNVPRVT